MKAKTELKKPGVVRMLSGTLVDIRNPSPDKLHVADIAWSLGRILRYNGSIRQDYTVAHHSVIMSYIVPDGFKLEALFHDAAEAYMGDVIWPIKALYPELERDEARLAGEIMAKFVADREGLALWSNPGDEGEDPAIYTKSTPVAEADHRIFQHECFAFGDRPGTYHGDIQIAWRKAINDCEDMWHAPMYAFLYRYHQLLGTGKTHEEINKLVLPLWFPNDIPEYRDQGLSDEEAASVVIALEEMS